MGCCMTGKTKKPTKQSDKTKRRTVQPKSNEIQRSSDKKQQSMDNAIKDEPLNPYELSPFVKQHAKLWHESYCQMKEKMQEINLKEENEQHEQIKENKQQNNKQIVQPSPRLKKKKLKSLFQEARNKQKGQNSERNDSSSAKNSGLQINQKKRKKLFNNSYVIKEILQNFNEQIGSCSICTEMYNDSDRIPMMICMNQHTFCQLCLNDLWNKGYRKCPLDEHTYNITKIQKNRLIMQIVKQFNNKSTTKQKINQ